MTEIKLLSKYNLWANQRIANWLLSNEANRLDKNCKSSFPTIGLTINHIWDAQIFYLSVVKKIPFNKSWDKSTVTAINGLVEQSIEFDNYTLNLGECELSELRTVKTKNLSGTFSQENLLQHCMNHSTFHRGQIITMGHQLELTKAPSTDLFNFLAEIGEKS
ncbi:hypothetical protein KMW28_10205 [Flammeovirga yaeyamensis]|uniref:DinB family protein n=1 Tax=Flammeovirga yaeyamensis TaxID=367791 RepID=A0AAX1MXS0_9BACT|nr:DinB family protein [Flammeovirga yaeyamensis]MBB3696475.1 putative damage-inducible protein DinB [Flammeovirga yaeyamensis]NMF35153.1 hypothetical protein [Flammeovirga yaeyamensis]QWG00027.1 hypothetical protein KMW28_10205 [Flammeovirga yaeyamensis]